MPPKDRWPIGRPAPRRHVGSHRRRPRAGARRLRVESLEDRRLLALDPIVSALGPAGDPLAPMDLGLAPLSPMAETPVLLGDTGTGAIHGTKWHDLNANGVKDSGEPGLPGWTIFLDQNQSGTLDAGERWTTTGANGDYAFRKSVV